MPVGGTERGGAADGGAPPRCVGAGATINAFSLFAGRETFGDGARERAREALVRHRSQPRNRQRLQPGRGGERGDAMPRHDAGGRARVRISSLSGSRAVEIPQQRLVRFWREASVSTVRPSLLWWLLLMLVLVLVW